MGRLSVIIGCMFSQKTTELMRRIRRYQSISYKVLVINFIADIRYGERCIASHNNDIEKALCVGTMKSLDELVRSNQYQVVAIDEGQFFPDLHEHVTKWADELPIEIVVAGLDGTFTRDSFGDMLRLIPHAEEVSRLSAYCSQCKDGTVAVYSKCILKETPDEVIQIGGADSYQPVCRKHYLAL